MQVMAVREFERIQCGDAFDPGTRTVTAGQQAALERFNEDYRRRLKVAVFSHGPKRSLVAQNFVGIINLGRHQLELLPKIDGGTTQVRRNLARMISTALELELHGDALTRSELHSESVLEALIRLFCEQLWQAVRRGMIHKYEVRDDNLGVLRGKLVIAAQIRQNLARPDRLFCTFDDFTEDNILNRVLKTALRILHGVARSQANLRSVAELLFCFQDVQEVPPATIKWPTVATDRLSARYAPVVRLARLFIEGKSPDVVTGMGHGFALLFDMNELFEAYIGAIAKKVFGRQGLRVSLQGPRRYLARRSDGTDAFALRPDIVLSGEFGVEVIVDSKWKRLRPGAIREGVGSDDAYQMHAYATQYSAREVMLLFPHYADLGDWKARRAEYTLRELGAVPTVAASKVSVATVDLVNLDTVARQLEEMLAPAARRVAA